MGQLEELSFPDGRHVSVITTLDGLLNGHHRHQNGHNGHHPPHNGHNDHMTTNGHHGGQSRDQNVENNSTGTGFDTADGDSGVEQIQNEISRVSPIPNLNHQEIKQENYYAESGYTSSINSVCQVSHCSSVIHLGPVTLQSSEHPGIPLSFDITIVDCTVTSHTGSKLWSLTERIIFHQTNYFSRHPQIHHWPKFKSSNQNLIRPLIISAQKN